MIDKILGTIRENQALFQQWLNSKWVSRDFYNSRDWIADDPALYSFKKCWKATQQRENYMWKYCFGEVQSGHMGIESIRTNVSLVVDNRFLMGLYITKNILPLKT
jgi:hypothetical protein